MIAHRLYRPPQVLRLMLAIAASAQLLACATQPFRPTTEALQAMFPSLEQSRVTGLYITGRCDYFAYSRGKYVSEPGSPDCVIDVEQKGPRAPFDQVARADFDRVIASAANVGIQLRSAFPQFDSTNQVAAGIFGVGPCELYVLEPGWRELPTDELRRTTAIDANWYRYEC